MYNVCNYQKIMDNFEGDEDILIEVIHQFEFKKNNLLHAIQVAINDQSFEDLEISAHTLKGIVSIFFAQNLILKCLELENLGKTKRFSNVVNVFSDVRNQCEKLSEELKDLERSLKNAA